jgi:hypothetical protein
MTLTITVITNEVIYQSADFRLVGQPDSRRSPKITQIACPSFLGIVTYSGIGSYNYKDVSSLVAAWLTGKPDFSIAEVATLLKTEGAKLVTDASRGRSELFPMTFVLAGFEDEKRPIVYIISNWENIRREQFPVERELKVSSRRLTKSQKAIVIATGSGAGWVTNTERKLLGNLAARYPHDTGRIRRRLELIHQRASDAEKTKKKDTITPHCVVVSFRSDGSGVIRLDPDADRPPAIFPTVAFGVNMADRFKEGLRAAGIDPDRARIVQAAFTYPSDHRPKRALPPCRFTVSSPEPIKGYKLREITGDGRSLSAARAINDNGVIVGAIDPDGDRAHFTPWMQQGECVKIFDVPGVAAAVNNHGEIAINIQSVDGQTHACVLFDGDKLFDLTTLPPPPGTIAIPTVSEAWAINDSGVVGGSVRYLEGEGSNKPSANLPACWNPGGVVVAQELPPNVRVVAIAQQLPGMSNCRVVDVNQGGILLIMAAIAAFDTRCILWDTSAKTNIHVGGMNANVFPIGLTNSGVILGQANNANGSKTAVICSADGSWQRLGTNDGWAPVAINDNGDVVGRVQIDGIDRAWLRLSGGELIMLPYAISHNTIPTAINNSGQIVGLSSGDHGNHAVLWEI